MTDEERQKCCAELRTADELSFYWRKLAADEIERLAAELKEAKRHDMRDWYDALERGRLELRVSELERKQAW